MPESTHALRAGIDASDFTSAHPGSATQMAVGCSRSIRHEGIPIEGLDDREDSTAAAASGLRSRYAPTALGNRVKKFTRWPSGSRNIIERLPHG